MTRRTRGTVADLKQSGSFNRWPDPAEPTRETQERWLDEYDKRLKEPPDGCDLARRRRSAEGEANQAGELAANRAKLERDLDHARAVVQAVERVAVAGKDVEWDKVAVAQAVIATAPDILRRLGPEVGHAKDRAMSVRVALQEREGEANRLIDEADKELNLHGRVPQRVWWALAAILGGVE